MGDHLLRQQDGWNTAAPTSSSAPMELTMELMGSKPFNPKVLAERVGFYRWVLSDLSVFQRDVLKSFKIPPVEPRSICLFRALLSLQFTSVRPKMESKWNRNLA